MDGYRNILEEGIGAFLFTFTRCDRVPVGHYFKNELQYFSSGKCCVDSVTLYRLPGFKDGVNIDVFFDLQLGSYRKADIDLLIPLSSEYEELIAPDLHFVDKDSGFLSLDYDFLTSYSQKYSMSYYPDEIYVVADNFYIEFYVNTSLVLPQFALGYIVWRDSDSDTSVQKDMICQQFLVIMESAIHLILGKGWESLINEYPLLFTDDYKIPNE